MATKRGPNHYGEVEKGITAWSCRLPMPLDGLRILCTKPEPELTNPERKTLLDWCEKLEAAEYHRKEALRNPETGGIRRKALLTAAEAINSAKAWWKEQEKYPAFPAFE
jgi:hypothetical protein